MPILQQFYTLHGLIYTCFWCTLDIHVFMTLYIFICKISIQYDVFHTCITVLSGSVEKCVSLGWCMLPVFDRRGNQLSGGIKASIMGGGARGDDVRLALYEGSPRMLLSIAHPIAGKHTYQYRFNNWLMHA